MTTQCVLYSNRLPIDIDANGTAQQQAKGGVAGALVNGLPDVPWVGPGSQALANHVRDNDGYGVPEEGTPRQLGVMEIEGEADPSSTYNLFYGAEQGGACNPDLWFDLHGLYQKGSERDPNHYPPPDYGPLEDPWLHSKWQAYEKINSAYAQLAIQYAGDKTVFLGQDYQVMRTPLHI
ncbi:MAG: hypothetical protein ACREP9_10445, partial [Candidatus Dormibacteraceae bacterium]